MGFVSDILGGGGGGGGIIPEVPGMGGGLPGMGGGMGGGTGKIYSDTTPGVDWNAIMKNAETFAKSGLNSLPTFQQYSPVPQLQIQQSQPMNSLIGQTTNFTQTDLANALTNNASTGWRNYTQAPHTAPTKWGI